MISCSEYDAIEIVCMFKYPIEITKRSGDVIQGIALDTKLNEQREECIQLVVKGKPEQVELIVLTDILKLLVCVNNPHFQNVKFN